jgi:hypothetical protein
MIPDPEMVVTWVETRRNPSKVRFVIKQYEDFLSKLHVALVGEALRTEGEVRLVFVQKPVQVSDELVAHGVVKIGNNEYPFKATLDLETGWVDVKSKAFRMFFKATKWLEDPRN